MAYVDPQTIHNPATGTIAPASWGDGVRDALEYLARNKPHARAYNSANLSIANNANTVVTLNSERFDVGAMHSTSSNTARLTVPTGEAGKYLSGGSGEWASNATGIRALSWRINGTTTIGYIRFEAATDNTPAFQVASGLYSLAAADYGELVAFQNSGGALNLNATGNYSPEAWSMWCVL